MPAKEIKELRQAGKLEDALNMAKAELEAQPENIWAKINLSWVYYDYLKQNNSPEHFDSFISWLNEIKNLQLPIEEKMLFEQISWQVGKMIFGLLKNENTELHKYILPFEAVQSFHFSKPSDGYSFLFKAFHKALKDTDIYIQFADWWDFKNFMPQDFQKDKLPNGKEVMSIAEQAYITYTKHLLPKQTQFGEMIFDKDKAITFLPVLSEIVENYPQFQYPAYFNAKLLLALGDKDNLLDKLLPFVKKKRNDFWAWEILAEAFNNDPDKVFACYCKALSCNSPEEMLVSLRQKMAGLLIAKKLYNVAKTEIDLLVNARIEHGFKIPNEVGNWQTQEWFKNASSQKSNFGFYKECIPIAESLLFSDVPEETVIVEFVNSDKKILNFIASESNFGFFKYDRFFKDVKIGETLKVRFQGGSNEGMHQLYTAIKTNDEAFKKQFIKKVSGIVKIPSGKAFGFLEDVFIHPTVVTRMKLSDAMHLEGLAIKAYNQEKKQWSWKLI
jgi:hypothetical protein